MEIGPIAGIRAVPSVKARPVDPELSALFDIESTAQAGDDNYSGSGKKAAGAEENDEDELEELEEAGTDEPSGPAQPENSANQISFFA